MIAIVYQVRIGFGWEDLAIGTLSSTLTVTGRTLMQIGVSFGVAGPCQALFSTYSLWQAIFSASFADQPLTQN